MYTTSTGTVCLTTRQITVVYCYTQFPTVAYCYSNNEHHTLQLVFNTLMACNFSQFVNHKVMILIV